MASVPPAGSEVHTRFPDAPSARVDRRLRLDDILKLLVADGLVAAADADKLGRSRTQRYEHPLEFVADQKDRKSTRLNSSH